MEVGEGGHSESGDAKKQKTAQHTINRSNMGTLEHHFNSSVNNNISGTGSSAQTRKMETPRGDSSIDEEEEEEETQDVAACQAACI